MDDHVPWCPALLVMCQLAVILSKDHTLPLLIFSILICLTFLCLPFKVKVDGNVHACWHDQVVCREADANTIPVIYLTAQFLGPCSNTSPDSASIELVLYC